MVCHRSWTPPVNAFGAIGRHVVTFRVRSATLTHQAVMEHVKALSAPNRQGGTVCVASDSSKSSACWPLAAACVVEILFQELGGNRQCGQLALEKLAKAGLVQITGKTGGRAYQARWWSFAGRAPRGQTYDGRDHCPRSRPGSTHILAGPGAVASLVLRRAWPRAPTPDGMVRAGLLPVAGQRTGGVCPPMRGPLGRRLPWASTSPRLKSLSRAAARRSF